VASREATVSVKQTRCERKTMTERLGDSMMNNNLLGDLSNDEVPGDVKIFDITL